MCREPKPSRTFTSTGKRTSSGTSSGSHVRGLAIPCASKKRCARYLSPIVRQTSGCGREHERRGERVPRRRRRSPGRGRSAARRSRTSCSATSRGERRDVAGVVDARDERAAIGVVERRRQRDRRRPRPSSRRRAPKALTMSTRCPAQVKSTAVTTRERSDRYGARQASLVPAVVHRLALRRRRPTRELPHVDDASATVEPQLDPPARGLEILVRELRRLARPRSRSRRARRFPPRASRARRHAPSRRSRRPRSTRSAAASPAGGTSRSARARSDHRGRSDRRASRRPLRRRAHRRGRTPRRR